jgi:hypothetical protein
MITCFVDLLHAGTASGPPHRTDYDSSSVDRQMMAFCTHRRTGYPDLLSSGVAVTGCGLNRKVAGGL